MQISVNTGFADGVAVVRIGGDLDVYSAPQLKESLSSAMADEKRLILDLTDVHFIDSTALGVLVGALKRSRIESGDFRLVIDDPYLLKIFRITGLDEMFPIFPDVTDAVSGN